MLGAVSSPRYRCTACGNLTRFDVTSTRRTRAFHHYTVGGDLSVESEEVRNHIVVCGQDHYAFRVVRDMEVLGSLLSLNALNTVDHRLRKAT